MRSLICSFCFVLVAYVFLLPPTVQASSSLLMQEKVLAYVAEHQCIDFNHELAVAELGMSEDSLFDYLIILSNENKIAHFWKTPRKPILLFKNDKRNYFWKIAIIPEEYDYNARPPRSYDECESFLQSLQDKKQ